MADRPSTPTTPTMSSARRSDSPSTVATAEQGSRQRQVNALRTQIANCEHTLDDLRAQLRRLEFGMEEASVAQSSSPTKRPYRSEWAEYSSDKNSFTRARVARMARLGIPTELRKDVWITWARVHHYNASFMYRQSVESLVALSPAHLRPIEQDIARTLSDHAQFSSPMASGIAPLRRILRAYSQRNPRVGYCQGMSLLAGCLLLVMEEEEAFWMFCTLLENILPSDYFSPGMTGLMTDQGVIKALLLKFCPTLRAHFDAHQFDLSMVGMGWLMTLYIDSCPLQTALRVWDILMVEGDKIIFCFALAVLHANSEELMTLRDPGRLSMALKQIFANIYHPNEILATSFSMMSALKREEIDLLRKQEADRLKAPSRA